MMPEQFPYPEQGWSTGTMRMAKRAPPTDPGYPIRELEEQRKKRETKVSQAEPHHQLPELSGKEAKAIWDQYNKDMEANPFNPPYEPQTKEEANELLNHFGQMFLRAGEKGAKEFMQNLPGDVEGYRVPLKGMFEGTEYQESDRMLYFRRLPKVS